MFGCKYFMTDDAKSVHGRDSITNSMYFINKKPEPNLFTHVQSWLI